MSSVLYTGLDITDSHIREMTSRVVTASMSGTASDRSRQVRTELLTVLARVSLEQQAHVAEPSTFVQLVREMEAEEGGAKPRFRVTRHPRTSEYQRWNLHERVSRWWWVDTWQYVDGFETQEQAIEAAHNLRASTAVPPVYIP